MFGTVLVVAIPLVSLVLIIWNGGMLWQAIRTHRWPALLFGAIWLGTWELFRRRVLVDPEWDFFLFWAEPLPRLVVVCAGSMLMGWWQRNAVIAGDTASGGPAKAGLLAALLVADLNALLVVVGMGYEMVMDGRASRLWLDLPGSLALLLLVAGLRAVVVGLIGGLIGGALASPIHRWRHRGGPTASAGAI